MFNIALASAFVISFQFSLGGRLLAIVMPPDALRNLPAYQIFFTDIFVNYWFIAIVIYIFLRIIHAQKYLRPTIAIQLLLGAANILLTLYFCALISASAIPGGGFSFVLKDLGTYIVIPSKYALYGGMLWLIARSILLNYKNVTHVELSRKPFFISPSGITALVMLFPPIVFITWVYISNHEHIKIENSQQQATASRFTKLCESAEVIINTRVKMPSNIYFSSSNNYYKDMLRDLDFVEVRFSSTKIQRLTIKADIDRSKKISVYDLNREEIYTPTARYQVKTKFLSNNLDRKLGINAKEIIILDTIKNEILAKYVTITRSNGPRIIDSCPENFFTYESNIVRYVLGMTDKIDTKGYDLKVISD